MKLILKKAISVVSGWLVSIPFFYLPINGILLSTILCIFFIFYYTLLDKLFQKIENLKNKKKILK